MKTILSILFLLFSTVFVINAQSVIAVQNGGTPSFYTTLDSAIINAHNGDTLFLPCGTFNLTVAISKSLHLIGVGHELATNMATGQTMINGSVTLENEASNGSLMGFELTGGIKGGENISNYMVRRCYFNYFILTGNNSNWTLIENGIGTITISAPTITNCFFFNNFLTGGMGGNFDTSTFMNNIFFFMYQGIYGDGLRTVGASNSLFENNIFLSVSYTCSGIGNSELNNNLFVESSPLSYSSCWGVNNIVGQQPIFVEGGYHLQETSPGKTGGKNGTEEGAEVGIYGGLYPWKDGALPPNPHFQLIDVAPKVDAEGNLNVRIKVEAQER